MNKRLKSLVTIVFITSSLSAQHVSISDSLTILNSQSALFQVIESGDSVSFRQLSLNKLYCSFCFYRDEGLDSNNMISTNDFIKDHLFSIKLDERFKKVVNNNQFVLIQENGQRSDIMALWNIYKENEISPGHEGGSFGIHFRNVNGEFKIAGFETIP